MQTTQAIYSGLFTNEVLPMRIGEVVRAYLVARWMRVSFVVVLPSIILERLFDGLWLTAGIGITALLVPLPQNLMRGAEVLGVIVMLAAGALIFLLLRPPVIGPVMGKDRSQPGLIARWRGSLTAKLAPGLQGIGRTRAFYRALSWSLVMLILQALSFWMVMVAYGLSLSIWIGVAVFLIKQLGTALPNAPANLGTYQFFTVVGLTLFGVDKTTAAGFSIVIFLLLTLPLWLIGFVALSKSGTTLLQLRREIRQAKATCVG